jgi:uncharacterized membrane protein YgaE (UPF0421/DUF939 family)
VRGLALHHFSSLSDFNTENKKKDEQKKQQKQTNTHTHTGAPRHSRHTKKRSMETMNRRKYIGKTTQAATAEQHSEKERLE